MKLNNKGFAITAVLYGLLILFVILVSSYLLVLSAKKDRVDDLSSNIEETYRENLLCNRTLKEIEYPYTTTNSGKYIFNITNSNTNVTYNCTVELEDNIIIEYESGKLMIKNENTSSDLVFLEQDCNSVNSGSDITSINKITYNCK